MKQFIVSCALALLTVPVFMSCSSDDDAATGRGVKGSYRYFEPCLQWESNVAGARTYMKSLKGWSEEEYDDEKGILSYIHKASQATITYGFKDGLCESKVMYCGCSEDFETMKNDLASKFELSWNGPYYDGNVEWYSGESPANSFSIDVGKYVTDFGGYMYADFSYTPYFY